MIRFLDILSMLLNLNYNFVFFLMIHTFLPLRKNWLVRILAFFACNFLSSVIIYSNDLANLLGALLGIIAYITIFHCGHWARKITAILVFYPALIAVNYFMQNIGQECFFFVTKAPIAPSLGWTEEQYIISSAFYMLSSLLRLLFWVLSWQILRKYLQHITSNLTVKMWFMVDALMLAPLVAIFTIIYFMPENPLIVYPICAASIFSSFGCIYLASYICNSVQTAYYVQELEMKQTYYHDRMNDEERIRSVYHDMKNHLLVLERQTSSKETARMAEMLQREIEMYEDYVHTGNDILDIILKEKSELARKKHISFSVTADLNDINFMEPLDISTIFGNSLDNAIEAGEKLPDGQGVILMKAGKVQNFLSILLENNCEEDNSPDRKRTTKKDVFLHGFGIANMKKAVAKYKGQLITKCENGTFTLKILIPIP